MDKTLNFNVGDIIHVGEGEFALILRLPDKWPVYLVRGKIVGCFWISTELVYKHNIDRIREKRINEVLDENI